MAEEYLHHTAHGSVEEASADFLDQIDQSSDFTLF